MSQTVFIRFSSKSEPLWLMMLEYNYLLLFFFHFSGLRLPLVCIQSFMAEKNRYSIAKCQVNVLR